MRPSLLPTVAMRLFSSAFPPFKFYIFLNNLHLSKLFCLQFHLPRVFIVWHPSPDLDFSHDVNSLPWMGGRSFLLLRSLVITLHICSTLNTGGAPWARISFRPTNYLTHSVYVAHREQFTQGAARIVLICGFESFNASVYQAKEPIYSWIRDGPFVCVVPGADGFCVLPILILIVLFLAHQYSCRFI